MIRARVPHRAGDLTAAGGETCLPIVLKSCPGQLPDPGGVQLRPSGRLGALVDVELRAVCDWPATAANPYAGPWNRSTARPILVVNPTFDPATSYQAAEAMFPRTGRRPLAHPRGLRPHRAGQPQHVHQRAREPLPHRWHSPARRRYLRARRKALHPFPVLTGALHWGPPNRSRLLVVGPLRPTGPGTTPLHTGTGLGSPGHR
jgi:TAP-like protein